MNTIEGRSRPRTPPFEPANQVELVVHVVCQGSMVRPVPARQPSIRWGRYCIFFSLRLTMRTSPARSAAAKLTMARLSSDQIPSAGLRSGAYAGCLQPQPLAPLLLGGCVPASLRTPHAPFIRLLSGAGPSPSMLVRTPDTAARPAPGGDRRPTAPGRAC